MDQMIYAYYAPLKKINATPVDKNDDYFDILILGASVLDPSPDWPYARPEPHIYQMLDGKTSRKIRVHNLAQTAMNSLDSRMKMEYLKQSGYDLVIFYDAINDARANYAPDDIFRRDYSHYLWYEKVHAIDRQRGIIKFTIVPYYLNMAWIKIKQRLKLKDYISEYWITSSRWDEYGNHIKTEQSYRDNLTAFLEEAKAKDIPVILPSFAYYDGRTVDEAGTVWGEKKDIFKAVDVHNNVIKELAETFPYDKIHYIDMNNLMTKDEIHFFDLCHFKEPGAEQFVSLLLPIILEIDKTQRP